MWFCFSVCVLVAGMCLLRGLFLVFVYFKFLCDITLLFSYICWLVCVLVLVVLVYFGVLWLILFDGCLFRVVCFGLLCWDLFGIADLRLFLLWYWFCCVEVCFEMKGLLWFRYCGLCWICVWWCFGCLFWFACLYLVC